MAVPDTSILARGLTNVSSTILGVQPDVLFRAQCFEPKSWFPKPLSGGFKSRVGNSPKSPRSGFDRPTFWRRKPGSSQEEWEEAESVMVRLVRLAPGSTAAKRLPELGTLIRLAIAASQTEQGRNHPSLTGRAEGLGRRSLGPRFSFRVPVFVTLVRRRYAQCVWPSCQAQPGG